MEAFMSIAGGKKFKAGTFVGDGAYTKTVNVGFTANRGILSVVSGSSNFKGMYFDGTNCYTDGFAGGWITAAGENVEFGQSSMWGYPFTNGVTYAYVAWQE